MRGLFTRLRGCGALLVLLVILGVPAYAQDTGPFDPPSARILPPIGVVAEEPPSAIIRPPGGTAAEDEPSVIQLFLRWLEAIIRPPIG